MKIKNTNFNDNAPFLKGKGSGKIKKNKLYDNKLTDFAGNPEKLKFVKNVGKEGIKKSENKASPKIKQQVQDREYNSTKVSSQDMSTKQKDSKDQDACTGAVSEKELKKIERKKAKKIAKKLKKQQNKANNLETKKALITSSVKRDEKLENKFEGISDSNKTTHLETKTNEHKQRMSAIKNVTIRNEEQLSKKEIMFAKKKQKQRLQNENGAETASNTEQIDSVNASCVDKKTQSYDATSSKVLKKKEKKAEKRQMAKEQKLSAENQTRDPAVDAATVFVGNLPVNTKRKQIVALFKKFGPVKTIRLRSAGGSILFKHKQRKLAGSLNAYVVLESKEKAEGALSLNGVEFKNNHLRITTAIKSQDEQKDESKKTVFVGNLKYSASEKTLLEVFSSCGEVDYVRCIRDGDKGCKGVAYICFKSADAVGLALELNGTIVDERPIHVERYNFKKLGAREARAAQMEKENNSKKGVKQRLEGKHVKKENYVKKFNQTELDESKKSKKSEFRGVKVNGLKKQKSKKKKSNDQMLKLAKKIAPKAYN